MFPVIQSINVCNLTNTFSPYSYISYLSERILSIDMFHVFTEASLRKFLPRGKSGILGSPVPLPPSTGLTKIPSSPPYIGSGIWRNMWKIWRNMWKIWRNNYVENMKKYVENMKKLCRCIGSGTPSPYNIVLWKMLGEVSWMSGESFPPPTVRFHRGDQTHMKNQKNAEKILKK